LSLVEVSGVPLSCKVVTGKSGVACMLILAYHATESLFESKMQNLSIGISAKDIVGYFWDVMIVVVVGGICIAEQGVPNMSVVEADSHEVCLAIA